MGPSTEDEMRYRVANFEEMYGRGVWVAPYMGPNGELILVAVTSQKRRVAEVIVPVGADHVGTSEALWEQLDAAEPEARAKMRVI